MATAITEPTNQTGINGITTSLDYLHPNTIDIDREYQRHLNQRQVAKIAAGYDPLLLTVVIVSERRAPDGVAYVVIDGQHRVEAIRLLGKGNEPIPCFIYHGLRPEQEAHMFWHLNKDRLAMGSHATFWARVYAGDAVAIGIAKVCEQSGVAIQRYIGRLKIGETMAFSTLEEVYRRGGAEDLEWVLLILGAAWAGTERRAFTGHHIEGMGRFLRDARAFKQDVNDDRLIDRLHELGVDKFDVLASSFRQALGGSTAVAVERAALRTYNKFLRDGALHFGVDEDADPGSA